MNLEISKTYRQLNEITSELSMYSRYSHDALLTKFISDRLEKSLRYYNIEIDKATTYLSTRYGSEMLKAIAAKTRKANRKSTTYNKFYTEVKEEDYCE